MNFIEQLQLHHPIIQAPMAGVSTPELAANISNAGGLGSLGVGATNASGAQAMIEELQSRTSKAFNINLFVHATSEPNAQREADWLCALKPAFSEFNAEPPKSLQVIYRSFAEDDEMLAALIALAPPVVSFHFGLPSPDRIAALKGAGCLLMSTATNLTEAKAAQQAGIDAIVAQGIEAGGHRGMFDPEAPDDCLSAYALTALLTKEIDMPVISAGGIMSGHDINTALRHGAVAAQLGTAFIRCPESSADDAYRQALQGESAKHTSMTKAISGRPARCLQNRFTEWAQRHSDIATPGYPMTYDAGKALNSAAKKHGETGFGAQWAGQGAARSRSMAAADLLETLAAEMQAPPNKNAATR